MRTFRTLLAVTDLYELVLHSRWPRAHTRDRERLLELVADIEECFHDLDDAGGTDDRRRLEDALHACQRADQVLVGLRKGGWPADELSRATGLLDRVGRFVCDELHRLDPGGGRRYERFH
jgi:hypothetical protein